LAEGFSGTDEDLTPEQIATLDPERKLRNSRGDQATRGQEGTALDARNHQKRNLAFKQYSCDLCNVVFYVRNQVENHKRTQKHLNNAAGITLRTSGLSRTSFFVVLSEQRCNIH
jgi:hypothetical protein